MIGILDYEAGNQTSVQRALNHLGIPCVISHDHALLAQTEGLIFPGVGQAGQAMRKLKERGLDHLLYDFATQNKPILGICLGCQILLQHSEEDDTPLLGLLKGFVRRFPRELYLDNRKAPVPHMGWNTLDPQKKCRLLENIHPNAAYYFVHSYYTQPEKEFILTTTYY